MSSPDSGTDPAKNGDVEKHGINHNEVIHDHDVIGNAHVSKEDAEHAAELSSEEAYTAKKLRIKIDLMIMPWVILVRMTVFILDLGPHADSSRSNRSIY
jgi:hypothetical protein